MSLTRAPDGDAQANASAGAARPGVVYLVGGGPGDPELITVRAADLLASADVVLHDELVHPAICARLRTDAELRSVGKRGGDPVAKQASQSVIEAELIALARSGRSVVRLKGGDPFLFGRGSEEAEALAAAGVPFEIVPGIPSPLGATAYAGISVTHRDLASSVTFVSGTGRDGAAFDFRELAGTTGTVCVLMGMRRIDDIAARLVRDARRDPSTPAAVIQWGTRAEQRTVDGRLDTIAALVHAANLGTPAIIVVGPVVTLRKTLRWFDARPLFGKRVLVLRPAGQAQETARLLRARGALPIELAAVAITPPGDPERVTRAVREVANYDVVAFTSENAVLAWWRELDAQGRDARSFGRALVAAIGSGTAAALAAHGIRADVVPADFRGETLAQAILDELARQGRWPSTTAEPPRVLLPRARVAREVLPDRLRAAGCDVDVVPVYETVQASAAQRDELVQRLERGDVDAVMLTSSSSADSVCDVLEARAAELLDGVLVASIGPITTAAATARGLDVAVTASESTTAGLVAAMERHFAGG